MFPLHKLAIIIVILRLIYDYFVSTPIIVGIKNPTFSLLGPYDTSNYYQLNDNDNYNQLIDIKNFTFKINSQPCQKYTAGLLLVIIVSSHPKNFEKRVIIRNTWGKSVESTKVVFLFGELEDVTISRRIIKESGIYGDIIQGNFVDSYRNMTYKHVMGLKWVSHHCPMARYVLKTDDDVVVIIHELRKFLTRQLSPWGTKDLIACQIRENTVVERSVSSKWKVSKMEYEPHHYPAYCAGWVIIYSQDVVQRLLDKAQSTPYFWIDDVHITGIIAQKIGVPRTSLSDLVLTRYRAMILTLYGPEYAGKFLYSPSDLTVEKMLEIWKIMSKQSSKE